MERESWKDWGENLIAWTVIMLLNACFNVFLHISHILLSESALSIRTVPTLTNGLQEGSNSKIGDSMVFDQNHILIQI